MRVLITGGAGFIGSHLAGALLHRGDDVVVLDDLSTGSLENVAHLTSWPGFSYTTGSVTQERLVADLVDECDVVFHLAAAVSVPPVINGPVRTTETNVNGTGTVLRHAARRKRLVVVASSSEVYGRSATLPFREDADMVRQLTTARSRYGTSKLMDESLALAYWQAQQLPVIVARLFATVGPRQSDRYGTVIPRFVRQALAGEPLIVHGNGSQTRSFTWVGDVVWALLALIGESRCVGQVFNVGNGAEVGIGKLAELIKAKTASRSPIRFVPHHEVFGHNVEHMPRRVPDIGKLQRFTGYLPTVELDEILDRVIDYCAPQPFAVTPSGRVSIWPHSLSQFVH